MSRIALRRSLLLFLLGQVILTSVASARREQRSAPLQIEIDVYSGRPNPSFEVSGPDAAELAKLLRDLPRARTAVPVLGLGYRGFVITSETGLAPGLTPQIRVFAGLIIAETGSAPQLYDDIHAAEAWLKRRARLAGFGALFN
jgi:hypothetical protein